MPFNRLAGRVLCVSTVLEDTYKVRSLKFQQQRQVQKVTNRQTSNASHECIPYDLESRRLVKLEISGEQSPSVQL